jgi:hypothetical protein
MDIVSDFQFTIYLSLLFLLFQLPIMNTVMTVVLGRFNVFFHPDGNLNFYGLMIKSALFGVIYYVVQKCVDFIVI